MNQVKDGPGSGKFPVEKGVDAFFSCQTRCRGRLLLADEFFQIGDLTLYA